MTDKRETVQNVAKCDWMGYFDSNTFGGIFVFTDKVIPVR